MSGLRVVDMVGTSSGSGSPKRVRGLEAYYRWNSLKNVGSTLWGSENVPWYVDRGRRS